MHPAAFFKIMAPQVGLEPTPSNRIRTQSPKGSVDFECTPPREPAITLPECSRYVQNQGLFEAGDIGEAMGAASAVGDDQIQRQPLRWFKKLARPATCVREISSTQGSLLQAEANYSPT